MATPFSDRQAGLAAITAAALILASQVTQLVLPMTMPESFWIATQSLRMGLALAAMFALLVALTALYARQAPAIGRLGLVGYLIASLGTLLVAGNWWYEAFIGPVLREQAPELLATAPAGTILIGAGITAAAFAAGWATFGIATFRAGVFPRRMGGFLAIAGLVGFLAQIAPFQVPIALAVGWMGTWLLRTAQRTSPDHGSALAAAG